MSTYNLKQEFSQIVSELRSRSRSDLEQISIAQTHDTDAWLNHWEALIANVEPQRQKRFDAELRGHGPLTELFLDEQVSEILVNGPDKIWYEKSGQWQQLSDGFLSELSFQNFIHRLAQESGARTDLNLPCNDGRWQDFRIHMASSPLTDCQTHISFRRHPKTPWTLDRLKDRQWAPTEGLAQLNKLLQQKKNFLVVGPTGCGKTSVLSACLQALPTDERVVIIEDTDEIPNPNSASTKMLTRFDMNGLLKNFDQCDLLKQCLRMRPSRIVVGEVRGGEAKDLLMAMATGHSGCIGSLHAKDARQALLRLELLVQMGAPDWSSDSVKNLIYLSLDAIVVAASTKGRRYLQGIYAITSLESVGFLLEALYHCPDPITDSLHTNI